MAFRPIVLTLRANPGGDACPTSGVRAQAVTLDAGSYEVRPVGPATPHPPFPGTHPRTDCYDSTAWSAWSRDSGWDAECKPIKDRNGKLAQTGWLHNYDIWSPDVGVIQVRGDRYCTPQIALAKAHPQPFALARANVVVFYLPTGGDYDDRGGLTLRLQRL